MKEGLAMQESQLSDEDYNLFKDVVLLSPGVWNGNEYTSEEIEKAFYNTDWKDKDVLSVLADHKDDDETHKAMSINDWLGYLENVRLDPTRPGYVIGDLRVYDEFLLRKLKKAPFGISMKVGGREYGNRVVDFTFKNTSVVVNPACKEAYINKLSDNEKETNDYVIYKVLSAEPCFENKELEETATADVRGSGKENYGLQPIKSKKDSKKMKGGKKKEKKMEEEEMKKEEVPEEQEDSEEKEEEKELSEEDIITKMGELFDKLRMKKEKSPTEKKMEELSKTIDKLHSKIKSLEEAKVPEEKSEEPKEEPKEEKSEPEETKELSEANPKTVQSGEEKLKQLGYESNIGAGTQEMAQFLLAKC